MKTKIAATVLAVVGAGASGLGANSPLEIFGSDALLLLMHDVAFNCGTPTYAGTASGNGETIMVRACQGLGPPHPPLARQTVAPMSRFLVGSGTAGACSCTNGSELGQHPGAVGGKNAEGLAFALDGLAIVANGNYAPTSCGGVAFNKTLTVNDVNGDGLLCPGCVNGNQYVTADPFDFLRVLYFGIHHGNAGSVCTNNGAFCTVDSQCPAGGICAGDCTSDVRRTAPGGLRRPLPECLSVRDQQLPGGDPHLWRRNDGSAANDVFVV